MNGRRSPGCGLSNSTRTLSDQVSAHQERSSQTQTTTKKTSAFSQIKEKGFATWSKENPKSAVNLSTNFSAAFANGASFILSNLIDSEGLNYIAEKVSFGLTKLSTVSSGIIGSSNGITENNPLNLVGSALELPVSLVPGHDLWLYRGIPLFGQNCKPIFNSLGIRNESGERDNTKPFSTLFKSKENIFSSLWENARLMFSEMPHVFREFTRDPVKYIKSSPHVVLLSTTGQAIGSFIAALGFTKVGAGVRNISGVGVDVGLALHKEYDTDGKPTNETTNYFISGVTWGGAAIIDFFKRFDFISEKVKGLSYLEYFLDRFANAYFVQGDEKKVVEEVKASNNNANNHSNSAASPKPILAAAPSLRAAFN